MNKSNQKEEILMATDYGYDVFRRLIAPDIKLGRNVLSPLREERHPSFSIYSHRQRGDIWYKDFSESGEEFHGDCFQFVQALYNLKDLSDAIRVIKQQVLGIYDDSPESMKAAVRKRYTPRPVKAQIETNFYPDFRDWAYSDLRYWKRFMISQKTLELFDVRPASGYLTVKGDKEYYISERERDPIYIITFPSGRMKIYRPLTRDRRFKWASNVKGDKDIFGIQLFGKPINDLFLMAGNKDAMSFHATTGMTVLAFNSESANISNETAYMLENFAKRIHTLYDNDSTGFKAAEKLWLSRGYIPHGHLLEKYSLPNVRMNDYAQLVDEQPGMLPDFFGRLKDNMAKVKVYQ